MNQFNVAQVASIVGCLQMLSERCNFSISCGHSSEPLDQRTTDKLRQILGAYGQLVGDIQMPESRLQLELAAPELLSVPPPNVSVARAQIGRLIETLTYEMVRGSFFSFAQTGPSTWMRTDSFATRYGVLLPTRVRTSRRPGTVSPASAIPQRCFI